MERLRRAAILLTLVEELEKFGSWCGETHIQKTAYFLQGLLGVPLGLEFILYKHGPFSFDLRDELTAMRGDFLLELRPRPAPYGPSYTLGAGSGRLKSRYASTIADYRTRITFLAEQLGGLGVADLERYATALFVTLNGDQGSTTDERAARIHNLKPHISVEQAANAVRAIDSLWERWGRTGSENASRSLLKTAGDKS